MPYLGNPRIHVKTWEFDNTCENIFLKVLPKHKNYILRVG